MKKPICPKRIRKQENMRAPLSLQDAIREANRCLLCADPPCSKGCPGGTDPGKFIRQIRFLNLKGAARTVRRNNIVGSVCAFLCPTEKLCEEKCSATDIDHTINIPGIQRFAYEYGREMSLEPLERSSGKAGKVAVIGAGPAGMACAAELLRKNYAVTVFEADAGAGGVARWGIPRFRLPDEAVNYDVKNLEDLGAKFRFNTRIAGKDAVRRLLMKGYKAVFIGTGLCQAIELDVFRGFKNTMIANDFLTAVKWKNLGRSLKGKIVAVIGGGSVAMDVASSARAFGAKKVYVICIEGLADLFADEAEIELARTLDVIFRPNSQIRGVEAKGKRITAVFGHEVEWIEPNNLSPTNIRPVKGTDFTLRVDLVVIAIGSRAAPEVAGLVSGLRIKGKGAIAVKEDGYTGVRGIFAGGDIANGGASFVQAVGDGKKAAEAIDKFIKGGRT